MNRTCSKKHFCEREYFNRKNLYSKVYKYEVIDPRIHVSEHEWCDGSFTNCIFQTDNKEEAFAFISKYPFRYDLQENGVCTICDMYDSRKASLKEGIVLPFYIIVQGISRHYGGSEEGSWYYNNYNVLEVNKAFTFKQGLKLARKLKQNYPQPKYNRYSCANRGEQDIRIIFCYNEADPRWPEEHVGRGNYE